MQNDAILQVTIYLTALFICASQQNSCLPVKLSLKNKTSSN